MISPKVVAGVISLFLVNGVSAQVVTRWQTTPGGRIDYTDGTLHPSGALFMTPRDGTGSGYVARLDPENGATLWEVNLNTGGGLPVLAPTPEGVVVGNGFTGANRIQVSLVDTAGTLLSSYVNAQVNASVQQIVYTSGYAVLSGSRDSGGSSYFWVMGVDPHVPESLWTYQEAGTGFYGARQLAVLPSGDVVAAGVVNNEVVVVRLTPDSGQVVWRTSVSPGALPSSWANVPGLAVTPAGDVLVAASVGNQALVARLDSAGSVVWSVLNSGQARGLALRDSLLYTVRYSNTGFTVTVSRRDPATGNTLWERSLVTNIRIFNALVDTAGNFVAAGMLGPLNPTHDGILALTSEGVTRYVGGLFGGDRIYSIMSVGTDILVAGDAASAVAGRYAFVPYLTGLSFVWEDGNNGVPNVEGDPLPGDSLFVTFRFQAHGDPMTPEVLLRCWNCNALSLADSVIQSPPVVDGDTFTVRFPATLAPGNGPIRFQAFHIYGSDTFPVPGTDTIVPSVREFTHAYAYTVLDDGDLHHPERALYSWVETTATSGIPLPDTAVRLDLPAPFTYGGVSHTSVWVGTAGWVIFGDTLPALSGNLPDYALPATHGMLFVAQKAGLNATLDTVQAGSLWVVIWEGAGVRAELVLDYGDTLQSGDDRMVVQYQTYTDSTLRIGVQSPLSGGLSGVMLWNGSQAAPDLAGPADLRVYTFLLDSLAFPPLSSPLFAWVWSDSGDNRPGSSGDSAVVHIPYANPGRSTGPVEIRLGCEDAGNGLCGALHFLNPQDTLRILPFVRTAQTPDSLQIPVLLDSTGQVGARFTLRMIIQTPVRTDTVRRPFTLVQDDALLAPESTMVGMNYVGLEPGDSTDLTIPPVSWMEINPDSGGAGILLAVDDDDDGRGRVVLPVPFVYDSAALDTLWVCTNGWAVLGGDPGTSNYTPDSLPGPTVPGVMAPFWTDLIFENYGGGQGIYLLLQDSLMVIQWANVQRYDNTSDTLNFQIQLRPGDSSIVFVFRTALSGPMLTSSTVGIQNRATYDAILVEHNGVYHGNAYPLTAGHFLFFRPQPMVSVVEEAFRPPALAVRLSPRGRNLRLAVPAAMNLRIQILDVAGRIRFRRKGTFAPGVHILPVPAMKAGIYFLRVVAPETRLTRKVFLLP